MSFANKLEAAILCNQSLLFVGLDPNPEMLPDCFRHNSDLIACLQAWMQSVIEQTADLVCAYKPTLGFYQALGAAGLELLQQVLSTIPPHIPVILDAKFADLNPSTLLAQTIFEQWRVDAVTEITETLYQAGRINDAQYRALAEQDRALAEQEKV